MTKIALTFAAGVMLGGFGITAASAAPAIPAPGLVGGDSPVVEVAHRRNMHHHRMMRRHSMRNKMSYGDPNSRNPSQPGYMQRKGTTSGGPRY